ncbi:DNA-binding SARP family transcriptional activator/Tfp pilus assembly protein PilF [Saccharothrix tamanrassetensis]|uniref:DNA-binding SARP family transcriptional activator/Tfp pilus assembly protein PilF n=1 Tax=Saccharothrix tamanrassetensis TaxID=1051531 RepID=A0A841CD31_9PSEU|nr:BTAD domain-containing putative transcriptional regulator [Saccharothrix tamanrassetensis]MBB5954890.1 DNA-binding SARP family transcriptional activator/Tfp pilus assembly protein PilF [Saccharothrix tamanrassetensis]
MTMEFSVLGPLEVRRDGEPVRFPSGKVRTLLAVLLLRANKVVPVDELVEILWESGAPNPSRARATLHMVVTRLRQALGEPDAVRAASGGYLLDVHPDRLDLHRYRALTAAGRYHEALDLWRGAPLPDVKSDAVHASAIAPLLEDRLGVLEQRVDADLAAGRAVELVAELRELTRDHPLRERFWGQLMLALYRSGRQADALAAYREVRELLDAELGVEPGPALRELHEHILIANPSLAKPRQAVTECSVPRMLPARNPHFVGRSTELAELTAQLPKVGHRKGAPRVVTIAGTAGVGKTTLAVYWANEVAEHFPGGRLYLNLRGFDPTGEPVPPAEAVRTFLDAFEVSPEAIPASFDKQVALYRRILEERAVLIVLDNARDAEQVRPLLPGDSRCFVIVTSRDRLAGLVANEGAHPVPLAMLDPVESTALLTRRLGEDRVSADPAATAELVEHCAGLPLALAIVAARAAINPHFALRGMAAELADGRHRLDYLDAGDPDAGVRNVFSWSHRFLGPAAARLFRLIGLSTAVDTSVPAAAALAGVPVPEAAAALAELTRAHLLFEQHPGRYTTYDLLRRYAAELAAAEEAEPDRDAAVERLLNWFLHTAFGANRWLRQDIRPLTVELLDGVRPLEFGSFDEAVHWFDVECHNLLPAAWDAFHRGWWRYLPALSTNMWLFLNLRYRQSDTIRLCDSAMVAARHLGDLAAESGAMNNLGVVFGRLGRFDEAIGHLTGALALGERAEDPRNTRIALNNLGMAYNAVGRADLALDCLTRALEICRAQEVRTGEAVLMDTLATVHRALGERERAVECLEQALRLNLDNDDLYSVGINLANLGRLHHELGRTAAATDALERALELSRSLSDRHNEALALAWLGDVLDGSGDVTGACQHWRAALAIFKELDAPETRELGVRLLAHAPVQVSTG